MSNEKLLNRVHDFLGKVVRDCPDQEMGLEASNLADDVWNVLHATEGLTFGQAVEAMKQGKKVARRGWNGKGMFLWLKPQVNIQADWCKDEKLKSLVEGNGGEILGLGTVCMYTHDSTGRKAILTGWLASQSDMLYEDWCIVE